MPFGHGNYQGLDLELLDPANEDERICLIEALHPELEDALLSDEEPVAGGEPFNPRLHITLHQVVAAQLLVGNLPETWQTGQRLPALGYNWHNIMHMIARPVSDDINQAMAEHKPFDPAGYPRRLNELPGGWPPPRLPEPN
jgi:hypothetical protein